jgi:hypothetical protein
MAQIRERIKTFEAGGQTARVKRLKARLAELERIEAVREPAVALRPQPKGMRRPAAVAAATLAPETVPAAKKAELVRTAYLRTLGRYPDARETRRALSYLNGSKNLLAGLRDLMWALVNTREFIVNR